MMSQFLVSNQSLHLNSTFQVFLKILSIEHMTQSPVKPKPKKRRFTGRIHVGSNTSDSFNKKWALDVRPTKYSAAQKSIVENRCLLIAFLLGLFQNLSFKSEESKFSVLSNVGSRIKYKRDAAISLLETELKMLFDVTKLQVIGPYHLQSTVQILSNTYKCQIYVFNGITNTKKLLLKYPKEFNEMLIQIFLFQSALHQNHIIFTIVLNHL